MKIRHCLVVWLLVLSLVTTTHSFANDSHSGADSIAVDVVIARPLWFVATVVGAGLFVVSLPVAAMSKSVDKTRQTLVIKPAQATFRRPLGDFSTID